MTRPKSITIISWLLIASSLFSMITSFSSFNNPTAQELMAKNLLPIPVQYGIMYTGLAILIICAIGMLQARAWARVLYIVWGITGLVTNLFIAPLKVALIPGFIVFAVVVYFLYRPGSSQFFAQKIIDK